MQEAAGRAQHRRHFRFPLRLALCSAPGGAGAGSAGSGARSCLLISNRLLLLCSSAALKTQHGLHRDQLARLRRQRRRWYSLGSPIVPLSPPPCPQNEMGGEAATRTRCSAARWFRSLVLALSKCLVAAAPKIRPVVSMAPAGCVAGPADCKVLDWLPDFLRRERSNGRVAMQTQLDLQLNLPMLQMVVGVREHFRSRPGRCFQATTWASKCISLLSVGVSS